MERGLIDDDPIITADDVIRSGACISGVAKVVHRLDKKLAAAMPASKVAKLVGPDNRHYVDQAARQNGTGDGSCYGSGYGSGSGSGYGDGQRDGNGAAYARP